MMMVTMDATVKRDRPAVWFGIAVLICIALVSTTALSILTESQLLTKFSLSQENNAATWWSGILLTLASMHAFDGHARWQKEMPSIARAWALISIVLLGLSADEVGSIHERVELATNVLGVPDVVALAPFELVLLALLGSGLLLLWSDDGQRHKVVPIVIAFGLFGLFAAVVVQEEVIQDNFHYPILSALEEGTELAGILILLKVAMSNTGGLFRPSESPAGPVFEAVNRSLTWAMVVGLAVAPVLALITANLIEARRGHPADWFTAVIFFAAALAAARACFITGEQIGWRSWALAALCLLASVLVVDANAVRLVDLGPLQLNLRPLIVGAGTLVMCVLCTARDRQSGSLQPATLVVALLAVLSAFATGLVMAYWLPQVVALGVFFMIRRRALPSAPMAPARASGGPLEELSRE